MKIKLDLEYLLSLAWASAVSKPLNLNRYRKIFSKKNHLKKHLTKYAPESLTLIIFFVKKYNTEIRNYLVNLNVTFIYLL